MTRPLLQSVLGLLVAAGLILGAQGASAAVLCLSQDAATGKFQGEVVTRDTGCIGDELQIGEIVDAQSGRIEMFGQQVQLPEGSFWPNWQEGLGGPPDATPSPTPSSP